MADSFEKQSYEQWLGTKGYVIPKSIHNQAGLDQYNAATGTPLAPPVLPDPYVPPPITIPKSGSRSAKHSAGTITISASDIMDDHARHVAVKQRKNRRIFFGGLTLAGLYVFWPELTASFGTQNLILGLAAILVGYMALATIGYVIRRIAATAVGSFIGSAIKVAIVAAMGIMAFAMLRSV